MIKIYGTSVMVDDQAKALAFYTEMLGFVKKADIPTGEHRWLTVVSPIEQSGVQLLLEPMSFPPAKEFQKAVKEAGIPYTSFEVDDLVAEHARLVAAGVEFSMEPTTTGPVMIAVLDDTCGNNIQLMQML